MTIDLAAINAERERIKADFLVEDRSESSARGLHHFALICSDVRRTIEFYQGLLEFPLTEIFGNRDYQGSYHFFFDIGHGNLLALFDIGQIQQAAGMRALVGGSSSGRAGIKRSDE